MQRRRINADCFLSFIVIVLHFTSIPLNSAACANIASASAGYQYWPRCYRNIGSRCDISSRLHCCGRPSISRRTLLQGTAVVAASGSLAMVATQTPSAARGGDPRTGAASSASVEILKSPQDQRLYRRVVLANGLEALLISDPEMAHSLAEDEQQEDDQDEGEDDGSDEEVLSAPDAL